MVNDILIPFKNKKLMTLFFLFIFFCTACTSLLYYPEKKQLIDPTKFGFYPKDVWVNDVNGTKIHAWFFEAEDSKALGTVIFFHGNAENLSTHFINLAWMSKNNYNVIIFDYPGYGKSEGKPEPANTISAGQAVIRWAAQKDSRPLIVYGQSLGGIIAARAVLDLKSELKFKTLILDSTFDSYRTVARRALAKSWLTWVFQPLGYLLMSDEYAPRSLADISPIPVLFIHSEKDRVVESRFSKEMYAKALEPKQLWLIPEGDHGSTFFINNKEYRTRLLQYLNGL